MLPDTMSQSAPRARPAAKGNRANEKWAGKKRHYENSENADFVGDILLPCNRLTGDCIIIRNIDEIFYQPQTFTRVLVHITFTQSPSNTPILSALY